VVRPRLTKRYAANSSNSALASFRSRVSKPSVNQPYTGASRSRACCDLPCSRRRRARLWKAWAMVATYSGKRAHAPIIGGEITIR
jgi:hypothetical protein